ncbi:glycoside hydrolase family 95 protein [Hypoxylon sp. FL1150]|nr:glycoside hydrolase family 95 protein [Hypoxylon sp. FL1150]
MKFCHILTLLSLATISLAALDGSRYLWYRQPAIEWEKGSLPIGNGRMGGTIYGSLDEVITINEDTIWSGPFQDRTPANGLEALPRARELLLNGNITAGGDFILDQMNAPESAKDERQFSYFGNLNIAFGHLDGIENYVRWLDTKAGNSGASYTYGDAYYTREYIASFPADILAARFRTTELGGLSLNASIFRTENTLENVASIEDGIAILTYRGSSGQPAEQGPILFSGQVRFVATGASIATSESTVIIEGATTVDLFIDIETNYRYPDPKELDAEINGKLAEAVDSGYDAVRDGALADSTALLERASINIGKSPNGLADLPTDERVRNARTRRDDVELTTLAWNLGRHMLVSSSRNTKAEIDFPTNLQGVWNNATTAPWGGKYTININTEMNYWPSMTTNLLETQEPLFDLMKLARPRGAQMARDLYGCEGTMYHHNLDVWADTAPTDHWRSASMWPMGAAWLVQHMIEHYRFTGDRQFLNETVYPYLVDVARFFECYTFEWEGWRITGPSLSPENSFIVPDDMASAGAGEPMDINIAMDDQLMRDLFRALLDAADELGVSDLNADVVKAREFITRIRPTQIGSLGQILEWRSEYAESEEGHRHFSHVYGLHPGSEFSPLNNETLARAAGISVDRRRDAGGGSTGWSRMWMINLYARLFRGDDAWDAAQAWFEKFMTEGLWNTDDGATFQIDGNMGFTSGITELFLQSHAGVLHILPALPNAISTGWVKGLTARGNFVVDIEWECGSFKSANVTSNMGADLTLRVENGTGILVDDKAYETTIHTRKGSQYKIIPIVPK